jgi:uncharacterized membrane protein YkgB
MQRFVSGSIWIHIQSQVPYKVLGVARNVANTHLLSVVYESTIESTLRDKKEPGITRECFDDYEHLPIGTMWIRDMSDFELKFQQYSIVNK